MQPYQNDISSYSLIPQIIITALSGVVSDAVAYPFDRLKVRMYARQKYLSKSFLHFQETKLVVQEAFKLEKSLALYYGIKSAIDRAFSMNVTRFLIFNFVLGRDGQDEDYPQDRPSPSSLQLILATLCSSSLYSVIQQPSNILKVKIQCEPLGMSAKKYETYKQKTSDILKFHKYDQKILILPGLLSGIASQSVLALSELFFFIQIRNVLKSNITFESQTWLNVWSAFTASGIASFIHNPFDFIHHRYVMRSLSGFQNVPFYQFMQQIIKNEGIWSIYKGILPNVMRNMISNSIMMFVIQFYLNLKGNQLMDRRFEKKQQGEVYKRG